MQGVARFLYLLADVAGGKSEIDTLQRKRLIGSLADLNWPGELGAHGDFLMYMAYDVLGFEEEANARLQACINEATGTWLRRKSFTQFVTAVMDDGRISQLRSALLDSTEFSHPDETGRIQVRLAELELEAGNEDECLAYCRDFLENDSDSEFRGEALKLMGRVYSNRHDYNHAALCFAGLLPISDAGDTQEVPTNE